MVLKVDLQETEPAGGAGTDESGGVQAVETGMRLIESLIELGPIPMLKTIAEHAGMPPPKAHRYLTSYCRSGLVERNPSTGGYQDRKSTRLNSSHIQKSRMPSSA